MVKTVPAALTTHKAKDVTAFATAWQITRLDGVIQRFANGSRDAMLDIGDGLGFQFYSAKEGFSRTNIANDSELNVGNLEVIGIFSGAALDETDLRRGIYDFADVKIMTYNQEGPSDGIIKMLRGQMAQVIVTTKGFFKVELRDLTQVFTKELGELYSKDCRADVGDKRCRVPIFPDLIPLSTALVVGDFYRIPTVAPDPAACSAVVCNFEGADASTSGPGYVNEGLEADPVGTGNDQIDTAQTVSGGDSTSSMLLDGAGDYLSFSNVPGFEVGANLATIQVHIRLNSVGTTQVICGQFRGQFSRGSWFLRVNVDGTLEFRTYQSNGSTVDVTIISTTVLVTATDYHIAMVKKSNGDWELFLDGLTEGTDTPVSTMRTGNVEPMRLGAYNLNIVGITAFFDGWIDRYEFLVGVARWETDFTPPTGNIVVPEALDPAAFIWEDFGDRVYEVTTAGTVLPCLVAPDETIDMEHFQGTAGLTAKNSFMRFAEVSAVGVEPRRLFTVTELTPNTGYTITDKTPATLGFDDGFFDFGGVTFDTGANATRAKEVRIFTADDGITITQDIELFEPMPFDIQVGDKLRIFPGCSKLHTECFTKFNNAPNFVGEPFVPGADTLGTYPDAH